jgi:DNA-binding NtrC family response regulator
MNRSLRGRILLLCMPLLAAALLAFFFLSWRALEVVINDVIARNAQFRAYAMGQALTQLLAESRNHLLLLASGELDQTDMAKRLKYRGRFEKAQYREVAFIGPGGENRYLFVNCGGEMIVVPPAVAEKTIYGPFQNIAANQMPGRVVLTPPVEVSYTLLPVSDSLRSVTFQVLRFSTAVHDAEGHFQGVLILSLDLSALRAALSALSIGEETDDGNGTAGDPVRSLFFDKDGWMLFQSESAGEPAQDQPLRTDAVRSGFKGDFGRPGFSQAFRPSSEYLNYWKMVADVQSGRSGRVSMPDSASLWGERQLRLDSVSYVPVAAVGENEGGRIIIGGLAVLDADFAFYRANTHIAAISIICFVFAVAALGACLRWTAGLVNLQIQSLAEELDARNEQETPEPLDMPAMPPELERIKKAANTLLERLRLSIASNIFRQEQATAKSLREPADNLPDPEEVPSHGLVGNSPLMRHLQVLVRKVAESAADVLVVGETGTGKELVSELIHRLSNRAQGPFISINCGALDESLLMDTLFGHVKGAFTEAKAERKGAFLAADGGTLMLDEVGNAAPKVQQALLRALSTRRIRPLGADYDVPYNTRIIAATNAEISDEAMGGKFREDLYYRLAVITIHTPPLCRRKEDIPMLLVHFLTNALNNSGSGRPRGIPKVSRGALQKLLNYNWPGNVRELKNCVTNALTFCEGGIILAEDIRIGDEIKSIPPARRDAGQAEQPDKSGLSGNELDDGKSASKDAAQPPDANLMSRLTPRQRRMVPQLAGKASLSRQEYQAMCRENISTRTALYDLQAFVECGLLRKEGRGPALRYVVAATARKA